METTFETYPYVFNCKLSQTFATAQIVIIHISVLLCSYTAQWSSKSFFGHRNRTFYRNMCGLIIIIECIVAQARTMLETSQVKLRRNNSMICIMPFSLSVAPRRTPLVAFKVHIETIGHVIVTLYFFAAKCETRCRLENTMLN